MQSIFALILLEPASAITAGVLGGAGILFFYFLRLQRRPVRVSSTLLWISSTADLQVNVPFRWIRFSLLLILQLLAMACLAVALGRPVISGADAEFSTAVVLIDQSASMSARVVGAGSDPPLTRLDLAKEEARKLLARLPSETRVLVAGFASEAVSVTGFSRDRGLLRNAVTSLPATDQPGDLDRAFELVRAFAGPSGEGEEIDPPRLFLLSDGGFVPGAGAGGIGRSVLEFVSVGGPEPVDNIGIVALGARRDYQDPSVVRLFLRVQSVVERDVTVPIKCMVGEQAIERTTLPVPASKGGTPGDASKTIEFQNTDGGVVTVTIDRRDDLDSDNIAGLTLRRPSSLRVLLVRPNIAEDVVDEVVKTAVEALGPASLRVLNAGEYERLSAKSDSDLVIFDRVRPAALPAVPSISFGATVPIPGLGVSAPGEGADSVPTVFTYWLRSHPLMRYVVLNEIWVLKPMRVTLPEESSGGMPVRAVSLASGNTGPLIVLVEQGGVRRVIVGFDVGQSNWVKDAGFHIFLKNAVDYLTLSGEEEAGQVVRTNEAFGVRVAAGSTKIEVSGPVSFSREVRASADRQTIGPLPLVGVYEIKGAPAEDSTRAVSLLDSTESAAAVRSDLRLATGEVRGTSASSAVRREVWAWFALAALVLLCLEWALYSWRMRV
ncbi:MAG: VWA domain-containing protein [Phycisphaerae bacterium]|nr:VWA domain-containing protein [Phycisphaerae bacterium]